MKLGYVIIYVADVAATVAFYDRAFGVKPRFVHESGYAEMETGATALGFASEGLAASNGVSFRPNRPADTEAAAVEIAFVVDDPQDAYEIAIAAGAEPVKPPVEKPWGQTVAYVRDLNGFLVELGTEVTGA